MAASATSRPPSATPAKIKILTTRHALYTQVRNGNPARWSGDTRNWSPIGAVTLNPERDAFVTTHAAANKQPSAA